ncbi:MAG: hypothetical protein ACXVIJ_09915, partial [Thermoanaerobaculia bacterium]
TLGVVFVIAVIVRLRAYTPVASESAPSESAASTTTAAPAVRRTQEPYEIVEAAPKVVKSAVPQRKSARDEAFERLLRTSSTSQGTTTATASTGTIQQRVAPPAPAPLSRTSAATPRSVTPPPARPVLTTTSSSAKTVRSTDPGQTTSRGDSRDPKDPTSDTTPPQLISVDFNPPQIHDGEETVLSVVATDDLSGVRVVSGTIGTPTGGLQGFALQREGDSTRYVSHIAVPKDAPEGLWKISYLSLSDNAGNTATLSANQGTLSANGFKVISSRSDTKPPVLRAVWLDRPAMRAGEKNIVFVQADDEGTGVNLVSGVFQSPSKFARIGFGCRQTEDTWQCDFAPPASADCGEWKLEQIQLQDKANNMSTTRSDNPLIAAVKIAMGGADCDSQPPQMLSIVLDRTVVTANTTINVTANVTDDLSGVASMSCQVTGPTTPKGTPRLYFSLAASPNDPNTWVGQLQVPNLASKGRWEIAWVQILDKANNLKTYSRTDAVMHNAVFNVQ